MLKKIIGLLLLIPLLLLATTGVAYAESGEGEDWVGYIEEKIVPAVILVITTVGGIYIAILPILTKMKVASSSFKNATDEVKEASEKSKKADKKSTETEQMYAEFCRELNEMRQEQNEIMQGQKKLVEMIKLGFCNSDELVKKGYAKEIAKVGKNEEL